MKNLKYASLHCTIVIGWKIVTNPEFVEGRNLVVSSYSPHLIRIHLVRYSTSAKFGKNPKIFI